MIKELNQQTILDFQGGKHTAFELVFKHFLHSLLAYTYKITRDQDEAEDITTEVFLSLFKRHHLFESLGNIRAFLFVSARNRCLNYLKAKKRSDERHLAFVARLADDTLLLYDYSIKEELVAAIYAAVEQLPEECRKIFKMIHFEEMKPAEIADVLQISVNNVYVQKSRAMSILKLKFSQKALTLALFIQVSGWF